MLITGAARRIGATIAETLAGESWHIIAHYNRSAAEAENLAASIVAKGGQCDIIQADLADRGATAALIPACIARFGALDALINNASSFRYDTLATMSYAGWDSHLGPNLEAPLFLAQAFAAAYTGAHGNIINMLDNKVTAPNPDFFSYTAAKLAQAAATPLLAQALAGRIRVNAIAPGITLPSGKQTQAGFERAWSAPPLGRSSTPQELAAACRYILATPSLNGQILVLDGGDSLLARPRDIAFST
jgi:NAD(P)-dependent dehydrogenase (short-subunit alcohol dehydrogenase family)